MKRHPIVRNFSALAIAQAVSSVASLITVAVIARALGPEAYGIIGFGVAVIAYLGLITNLGTDAHGVRAVAKDDSKIASIVGMAMTIRTLAAIACFSVLVCFLVLTQPSPELIAVMTLQGIGLFFTAWNIEFAYQGMQRMTAMAARQVFAALTVMVATILLISDRQDLYIAAAIPVVANILSAWLLIAHFRISGHTIQIATPLSEYREFLQRLIPVAVMGFLFNIHVNLDIVLLGFMRPSAEVGLYAASSRVFVMALIATGLLQNVFLPVLAKVGAREDGNHVEATNYAQIVTAFGGAALIGGAMLSGPVLELLFGSAFRDAETALTILMIGVSLIYFSQAYGTPFLAWQSDRAYLKIVLIGAATNLGLNLLLIPVYGIEGAATATVIAQLLILFTLAIVVRSAYRLGHMPLIFKVIAIAAVMALPLMLIRIWYADLHPVIMLIFGALVILVYIWVLVRVGIIDWNRFRSMQTDPET